MKKIFLILLFLYPSLLNSQWIHQNSGTNADLSSVCFVNQYTGWIVGVDSLNGIILKTTNAGENWILIYNSNSNYLRSVQFINQNTGWIVGNYQTFPNYGIIYKTTDGGINWENQLFLDYTYIFYVQFIDQNTGWVVGDYNFYFKVLILKTTNGGNNWFSQDSALNFATNLNSVFFVNQNTGWVAGGLNDNYDTAIILKTTNSGTNWFEQRSFKLSYLKSVFFTNPDTGWAAGYDELSHSSLILKTTNSGVNWVCQDSSLYHNLEIMSIYFTDQFTGYISGSKGILKTKWAGFKWIYQDTVQFDSTLNSIYFTDQFTGWAVGNMGTILKTTTGGELIGINPISKEVPKSFSLSQNYPNPFNPSTKIKFSIPPSPAEEGRGEVVKLIIYDILGREVTTLVNEKMQPGSYEVVWNGTNYSSGIYFYKLQIDNASAPLSIIKRMVLLK